MAAPSVAIVDALASLAEADLNSIFRFVGPGSSYLQDAPLALRDLLTSIHLAAQRQSAELVSLIRSLGGKEPSFAASRVEDQHLSHLSLKFLILKLVDAKRLCIERYRNALQSLDGHAPPAVRELLERHLSEDQRFLESIQSHADIITARRGV